MFLHRRGERTWGPGVADVVRELDRQLCAAMGERKGWHLNSTKNWICPHAEVVIPRDFDG